MSMDILSPKAPEIPKGNYFLLNNQSLSYLYVQGLGETYALSGQEAGIKGDNSNR